VKGASKLNNFFKEKEMLGQQDGKIAKL